MAFFGALLNLASCWYVAFVLFSAWWYPLSGENYVWIRLGVAVIVLEFILVHSGVFMAAALASPSRAARVKGLLALTAFYSLFAIGIAVGSKTQAVLWVFGCIMFSRILSAISGGPEQASDVMGRSALSAILYLLLAFMSVLVPFPQGGLNSEVLARYYADRGRGLWEQAPQQALAMGVLYFFILGLCEVTLIPKGRHKMSPGRRNSSSEPSSFNGAGSNSS